MERKQFSKWLLIISVPIFLGALLFFWIKPLEGGINSSIQLGNKIKLPITKEPKQKDEPTIKLLAFGDLMLDRNVGAKIKENDPSFLFAPLASSSVFLDRNLVMANLEGAVIKGGAHFAPQNAYDFSFAPEKIQGLKKYGFNFFNLANNHFSDQGSRGVTETRQNLTTLGLDYSGSIDAQVDSHSVTIKELNGQPIALIGLSMVYQPFDLKSAEALIKEQKKLNRLVIVNIHWGIEYQHQFSKTQQQIGYSLVDAGANLIIGHHPHVIEGMEIYHQVPIFYSLGNFIFDQYFSPDTQQGLALKAEYQKIRSPGQGYGRGRQTPRKINKRWG